MSVSYRMEDHTSEVLQAFHKQVEVGLEAIGMTAEKYAKVNCPVDTGRLRNSISHNVDEKEVVIGSNVEYAPWVEFIDRNHITGRAHFLRDAACTHGDEYKMLMQTALKS